MSSSVYTDDFADLVFTQAACILFCLTTLLGAGYRSVARRPLHLALSAYGDGGHEGGPWDIFHTTSCT